MNEQVKQQWIGDLLDNPNSQGRGALRPTDTTFCCLGRLCHLHPENNWTFSLIEGVYVWENENTYIPYKVKEWAELSSDNPLISVPANDPLFDRLNPLGESDGKYVTVSLISVNDNGFTFEEIAHLIDKYL